MTGKTAEELDPCQYYYPDLKCSTLPDSRTALPLRRLLWQLKRNVWYLRILGPLKFVSRIIPNMSLGKYAFKKKQKTQAFSKRFDTLNLNPGEWVEVRSVQEIFATLDEQGKLRGLSFTTEMTKFCGQRFRVYKRLENIILEATGELRKIKTPTVLLEGVFCDGKAHGNCDRSCFCFWRESWLKRRKFTEAQNQK